MYCLDTSTLSATGLQNPPKASEALRWLDENAHAIHVPAVVLAVPARSCGTTGRKIC